MLSLTMNGSLHLMGQINNSFIMVCVRRKTVQTNATLFRKRW